MLLQFAVVALAASMPDTLIEWHRAEGMRAVGRFELRLAEVHQAAAVTLLRGRKDRRADYGNALNDLGGTQYFTTDGRPAADTLAEAVRVLTAERGPRHPDVGRADSNLGLNLSKVGRYRDAEAAYAAAGAALPEGGEAKAEFLREVGVMYQEAGRPADAVRCLRRAIALGHGCGESDRSLASRYRVLAQAQTASGDAGGATESLKCALANPFGRGYLTLMRAQLLLVQGEHGAAKALLGALMREKQGDRELADLASAALAEAEARGGDPAAAAKLFDAAEAGTVKRLGPTHPHVGRLLETRARLLPDGAEPFARRAAAIREANKAQEPLGVDAAFKTLALPPETPDR